MIIIICDENKKRSGENNDDDDENYNLDKILNHYLVFIPATLE